MTRQFEVITPHFSLPFRFGGVNGAAFVNEQDTSDDIIDCIRAILFWPVGQRDDMPDFGTLDLAFTLASDESLTLKIRAAIQEWEPRAEHDVDEASNLEIDELVRNFIITVKGLAE
jgi:phage baseplate assembly protein W